MKVLVVTNMYPIPNYSYYGIHVKEQIESIEKLHRVNSTLMFINGRQSKLNYLYSIVKINRWIYQHEIDIIHVHYGLSALFLLFNPLLKIPVLLTLHGSDVNTDNLFIKFLVKKVIRRSNKIIVMNPYMLERVKNLTKCAEIIPCGVDLEFFKPRERTVNRNLTLGFPGTPERTEKNYALFLKVKTRLSEMGYTIEEVIFHNFSREEVVNRLNFIDFLILTSFSEGSPQIIKEALACNTCIVSVPVGDVPKILEGVPNCRVAKDYQVENLTDMIFEILDNKQVSGAQGRERLKTLGLDQASVASRVYDCYKELLQC